MMQDDELIKIVAKAIGEFPGESWRARAAVQAILELTRERRAANFIGARTPLASDLYLIGAK